MSAWAKPGVKCVCLGFPPGRSLGWGIETVPVKDQILTIREVETVEGYAAIRFEEIVNPPLAYHEFVGEAMFDPAYFRPIISKTQEDDIAEHFSDLLKTDHRATRKQGEDA